MKVSSLTESETRLIETTDLSKLTGQDRMDFLALVSSSSVASCDHLKQYINGAMQPYVLHVLAFTIVMTLHGFGKENLEDVKQELIRMLQNK